MPLARFGVDNNMVCSILFGVVFINIISLIFDCILVIILLFCLLVV